MRNLAYLVVIFFLITSCSVKKKPIFLRVGDIKVMSYKLDTVHLQAKAYFKNENNVGGKISTDEIKVFIDGQEVAQVSSEEFKVPANREFNIPLKVRVPTKKIFDKKGGFLQGLLSSILSEKVDVQFKGDIKYKFFGFSRTYTVDKTEEVRIKL